MELLTGASENHAQSLLQFLNSVAPHLDSFTQVTVFDLGLSAQQRVKIDRLVLDLDKTKVQVKTFDFAQFPKYVDIRINAGAYAWKPIIIADAVATAKVPVMWLDAGCLLTQKPTHLMQTIAHQGLYSPVSQGTLLHWTHTSTLKAMKVIDELLSTRNRSGGVVGVDPSHRVAVDIIQQWKMLALNPHVLCPVKSSRKNHRQDQSLLSILINQAIYTGELSRRLEPRLLDVAIHCDVD